MCSHYKEELLPGERMSLEFMRLQERRIIATFGTLDINIDDIIQAYNQRKWTIYYIIPSIYV